MPQAFHESILHMTQQVNSNTKLATSDIVHSPDFLGKEEGDINALMRITV
jgi:hypothetical protein